MLHRYGRPDVGEEGQTESHRPKQKDVAQQGARRCDGCAELWHIDLTILPTVSGWWAPWFPSRLQRWPFCWLGAVLDLVSRSAVAWKLFAEPDGNGCRAARGRARQNAAAPASHRERSRRSFRERTSRGARGMACDHGMVLSASMAHRCARAAWPSSRARCSVDVDRPDGDARDRARDLGLHRLVPAASIYIRTRRQDAA